ncbi:MAG TPA: DUF1810 domain-containing protein [Actinoplanes sp.]|nr:DUF1810 domain-containing protein [Actinoplanes sp.]
MNDLDRFVRAQADVYDRALAELSAGHKRSHWMWFIFPQYDGLGSSVMADRYAIRSLDEARAYLEHPVLGPRLEQCASALLEHTGRTAAEILGYPDDLKLRSSMTLFARASADPGVFQQVLDIFYDGPDPLTVRLLDA